MKKKQRTRKTETTRQKETTREKETTRQNKRIKLYFSGQILDLYLSHFYIMKIIQETERDRDRHIERIRKTEREQE